MKIKKHAETFISKFPAYGLGLHTFSQRLNTSGLMFQWIWFFSIAAEVFWIVFCFGLNTFTSQISNLLLPLGTKGAGSRELDTPIGKRTTMYKKKEVFLAMFQKPQENTFVRISVLLKKKQTPAQVFSFEFLKILEECLFYRTFPGDGFRYFSIKNKWRSIQIPHESGLDQLRAWCRSSSLGQAKPLRRARFCPVKRKNH